MTIIHPLLAQIDIIDSQTLASFAKLDTIQELQLMMTLLIGGLLALMLFQQRNTKSASDGFSKMVTQLLTTMSAQTTQSNDREKKLTEVNELQAKATGQVAKALLIINREQKRQGKRQDEMFEVIANLTAAINTLVESVNKLPGKHDELLLQMRVILGYVEGIRLKMQTREAPKLSTGEIAAVPVADIRAESSVGFKQETSDPNKH